MWFKQEPLLINETKTKYFNLTQFELKVLSIYLFYQLSWFLFCSLSWGQGLFSTPTPPHTHTEESKWVTGWLHGRHKQARSWRTYRGHVFLCFPSSERSIRMVLTCVSEIHTEIGLLPAPAPSPITYLWQAIPSPLLLICVPFKLTKTTTQQPSLLRHAWSSFWTSHWCCVRSQDGHGVLRRQAQLSGTVAWTLSCFSKQGKEGKNGNSICCY